MDKTERQIYGATKWRDNKGLGGFEYPTGFGKMYTVIYNILIPFFNKNPDGRVVIVVNSDALRGEWKLKLKEAIDSEIVDKQILVETIQYFQTKRLKHFVNLLVLDEMSQYFSDDRKNIYNKTWIEFKFLIWLDATPEDRNKRDKEFYALYPCIDRITKKEAVENNWVTKSNYINYGVELTSEELEFYQKNENDIDENFQKLERNFQNVTLCLQGGECTLQIEMEPGKFVPKDFRLTGYEYCTYLAEKHGWRKEYQTHIHKGFPVGTSKELIKYETDICNLWGPEKIMGYARKTMAGLRNRLQTIYTAKNKIKAVVDILEKYPASQTIIFSQRINFCEDLTNAINRYFGEDVAFEYHSQMKSKPLKLDFEGNLTLTGDGDFAVYKTGKNKGSPKFFGAKVLRDLILTEMRDRKFRVLVTGSGLDRGLDIPTIDLGIVCGFTKNVSQTKQREGRLTRLDKDNKAKAATYINIYVKDTVEEQYLREVQRGVYGIEYISHTSDIGKEKEFDV